MTTYCASTSCGSGCPSCSCPRWRRCRPGRCACGRGCCSRTRESTRARRTWRGSTGRWRRRATIPRCAPAYSRSARCLRPPRASSGFATPRRGRWRRCPSSTRSGRSGGRGRCAGAISARSARCFANMRARASSSWTRPSRSRRCSARGAGRSGRRGPRRPGFLALAVERGEEISYAWLRLNLTELELRAGEWDAAERLLDEWADADDGQLLITPTYQRCRALLAAGRGDPEAARAWGEPALAEAEARDYRWQVLESTRALGSAALLAGDLPGAAERLRAVWTYCEREGVDDPGAFPVAPDLVETLVELGELDEARAVTRRLGRRGAWGGRGDGHPWAALTARRCAALIDAGDLAAIADAYEALGLRFDAARSSARARPRAAAAAAVEGRAGRARRGRGALRRARLARLGGPRAGGARPASAVASRARTASSRGPRSRSRGSRRRAARTGRSRTRCSSPCTRSRRTCRARTRSSACGREGSSPVA